MNNITQNQIIDKFPKLFKQTKLPMTETAMCFGLECGNGWAELINDTCTKLQTQIDAKIIPQIEFTQVKEKYGTLRIYFTPYDEKVNTIIDKAEKYTSKICEICGTTENVSMNSNGWISTLCDKCRKKKYE